MRKIIMMSVLFLLFVTGIMIYLGNEGYCYKTGKFFDETPIQERIDKILMQHNFIRWQAATNGQLFWSRYAD